MRRMMKVEAPSILRSSYENWPLLRDIIEGGKLFPEVDIEEKGDSYLIEANVPGVNAKDINVQIVNNTLSINGIITREQEEEDKNYIRTERTYGEFYRSFYLPDVDNASEIDATCKDGVLRIKIPKTKSSRTRQIEIKNK